MSTPKKPKKEKIRKLSKKQMDKIRGGVLKCSETRCLSAGSIRTCGGNYPGASVDQCGDSTTNTLSMQQ